MEGERFVRLDSKATCVKFPFNDSQYRGASVESDERFYRRRAAEELAAASRAVTAEARDRRIQLAHAFLDRLKDAESSAMLFDWTARDPAGERLSTDC